MVDVFLLVGAVACMSLALTTARERPGRWQLATAGWVIAGLVLVVAFAVD